jgi:AraC-like DNA-binding protein
MNLIQSQKNRYAWKLEPYDTLWHQGDYLAKAEYFGLPPGQYHLYYKAANNDGIWTVPSRPLQIIIKPHFYQTNWFIVLMLALFLLLVGILIGYRHYIARQIEKKRRMMRYSWSHLDEAEARRINEKLLDVMQDKNIYLEPDLSLNKLASIMEVKPNYLSQIINQFHGQNFFEFINTYRIEEAKRLLCGTTLKVEAVAYDSGFNSLSTFNAAFKKATQTTPTAFRKSCPEKRA